MEDGPGSPELDPRAPIDAVLEKSVQRSSTFAWSECHEYRRLRALKGASRADALRLSMAILLDPAHRPADRDYHILCSLVRDLLAGEPPLDEPDIRLALECTLAHKLYANDAHCEPAPALTTVAERWLAEHPVTDALAAALRGFRSVMNDVTPVTVTRGLVKRIDALLGDSDRVEFDGRDAWTVDISAGLERLDPGERAAWLDLFRLGWMHDAAAHPSKTFVREADAIAGRIGGDSLRRHAVTWFTAVAVPSTTPAGSDTVMRDRNALYLRAVVWTWARRADTDVARALADLALVCFTKLSGVGAYSDKVGNACVYALGEMPSGEAVAQLGRLKLNVKYRVAVRLIEKAYQHAADRAGITVRDVQELSVPTHGLDADGIRRVAVGAHVGELHLAGSTRAELRWLTAEGQLLKGVPAEVRSAHGDALKTLKTELRHLNAQLAAQRARVEELLAAEGTITFAEWRERYADHPLLTAMAGELIWTFETGDQPVSGILHQRALVDCHDRPLDVSSDARVRLWHPAIAESSAVIDWRQWLFRHAITQPFKQAHRETCALTADESSGTADSMRFFGHVLREHILEPLCRQRGWRYFRQLGQPGNQPTLALPRCQLTAEFRVHSGEGGLYSTLYADQVRFLRANGDAVPLAHVPPLVFSEVRRDVELFVSVASITVDPGWHDREGPEADFWKRAAFGELSAAAAQRRDVLQGMLRYLKIGGKCRIDDRFLVVEGQLRTYRIHIGSGQVLMDPADYYLGIAESAAPPRELPQGDPDTVLGIILKKALTLVNDTSITDPAVRRIIEHASFPLN